MFKTRLINLMENFLTTVNHSVNFFAIKQMTIFPLKLCLRCVVLYVVALVEIMAFKNSFHRVLSPAANTNEFHDMTLQKGAFQKYEIPFNSRNGNISFEIISSPHRLEKIPEIRGTYLLLSISMLWHREAIFGSKGDKLPSSAECKIRTQDLWNRISSTIIVKHVIVQKCERLSYHNDIPCILCKKLETFGMQPFFSKIVQGSQWFEIRILHIQKCMIWHQGHSICVKRYMNPFLGQYWFDLCMLRDEASPVFYA